MKFVYRLFTLVCGWFKVDYCWFRVIGCFFAALAKKKRLVLFGPDCDFFFRTRITLEGIPGWTGAYLGLV